jgi:hypothetical protein
MKDYQQIAIQTDKSKVLINSSAAAGKALENGSVVYTADGPKLIENCKIGDKIYGEDGELHNIIGVYPQGKKKKYLVKFSDRTVISCCDEHLWTFQTESMRGKRSKNYKTETLRNIIDNYEIKKPSRAKNNFSSKPSYRKNIFLPMTQPINFPHKEVPLDAYVLGALLGDGHLGDVAKTSTFSNQDLDVINKVNDKLQLIGCHLKHRENYDYCIIQNANKFSRGKLTSILIDLGLNSKKSNDKFIPDLYKYNSVDVRLELLKGIIDTDGYHDGRAYDICLKSQQLILDIKEICESLGFTAVYTEKETICSNSSQGSKNCGTAYRLRIKTNQNIPKIHSSERREKQWKTPRVWAFRAIEEIIETDEYVEMTCIKVDNPSCLFVTNSFIVTHNTHVVTERVRNLIKKGVAPDKIVVITFTNNAAEEMKARLGEDGKGVFINTIHSYVNYILLSSGVNTRKYLDNEDFDKLFDLVKEYPYCIKEVEHLLLDEAQDSDELQIEFILDYVKPKNWFFVFDLNQAIYNFKGSRPDLIEELMEREDTTVFNLPFNHRNDKAILNFAKRIIDKSNMSQKDESIALSENYGQVIQTEYSNETLLRYIAATIKQGGKYSDWFVLGRSNAQVENMYSYLTKNGVPCDTFKRAQLTNAQLNQKMKDNTVKVLTIHSSKGLESPYVAVQGALFYNDEERRVSYVAATRAKHLLLWFDRPKKIKTYNKKAKTKVTNWE